MLLAPVLMPDPLDGERPIPLQPTLEIWLALEKAFGALGFLFMETKYGRVRLEMQIELLYRCAREAGSTLKWKEVAERVRRLGLYRTTELVLELFTDVIGQAEVEGGDEEGDRDAAPLASGDSAR